MCNLFDTFGLQVFKTKFKIKFKNFGLVSWVGLSAALLGRFPGPICQAGFLGRFARPGQWPRGKVSRAGFPASQPNLRSRHPCQSLKVSSIWRGMGQRGKGKGSQVRGVLGKRGLSESFSLPFWLRPLFRYG